MSKHNIKTDSYFKEQIMDRGETISSACDTLIAEIPNEILQKLSAMSFDKAKIYVNYVYADFDSTKHSLTNTEFSVRLSYDSENIINQCSNAWGTKANKSKVIRILLAVGIMYQDYKCYNLKETKPLSFKMSRSIKIPHSIKTASSSNTLLSTKISPPYICYQHGNKNNPNIKAEITKILEQIPDDIKTVVEPFMGMCALTINVLDTLSDRTLDYYANDKDNNLFNLYECVCNNYKKLLRSCEILVKNLETGADNFDIVKSRHLSHNYSNNYDAAADYMYLDAVSVRHDKKTLKYKSTDKQIKLFNKYIFNIRAMHNYLIKTKISHKDALKMLKIFKNIEKILYLLDPPYISSLGYSSKTNKVKEFTYYNWEKLVFFCKNNIPPDSIFLLFCRFTATRSQKNGETFEDVKIKEQNGYFETGDRTLRGFYKRVFGVETKGCKHKFFYKEIPFDGKGTMEVIISNYQFDGFKPF
ncbi:MAG: DNA adenine methylase [Ruminococcus sp.]|nr:DNA adenine methylase [Ruminococcus sp.]